MLVIKVVGCTIELLVGKLGVERAPLSDETDFHLVGEVWASIGGKRWFGGMGVKEMILLVRPLCRQCGFIYCSF